MIACVAKRVAVIGRAPLCNLDAQHAPRVGSWCFPLCWRCSALAVGIFLIQGLRFCQWLPWHVPWGLLLCLPCGVDCLLQRQGIKESTTCRRVVTGFLAGVGIALL